MPTAATTAKAPQSAGKQGAQAPVMLVPFPRAAKEHIEPFVDQITALISANTQQFGPFDVPAYGYLRHIVILVQTSTSGVGAGGTPTEDAPFSALTDIQLSDVNGAPIFGPVNGFDLYLATKYGGYEFSCDPRQLSSFSQVAATGNLAFSVKIPVEICERDSLGSIANQNASSTYKLRFSVNNAAGIFATPPATSNPSLRIRAYLEAWTQPPVTDLRGQPNSTTPPAHGTSQYWSKYTANALSGSQTVRLSRVGNFIREVLLINRRVGGTRVNGQLDFPDPAQWFWDTRLLHNYTKQIWSDVMTRRTGYTGAIDAAGGLDSGVFVYDFDHEFDGKIGRELRDGWLPTVQSTRLEVQGSWANTVNMDILTNDVAPNGEVFI